METEYHISLFVILICSELVEENSNMIFEVYFICILCG